MQPLGDAKYFRCRRQSGHTWRHLAMSESDPPADIWVSVRYPHSRTFRMGTEAAISAPTLLDQSTLRPWIDQTVGTVATPAPCKSCAPFMNQIATVPLELRQRMSLLPSPLKSPVSMIDQSVG